MTPLAYSVPGFGRAALQAPERELEELRSLGFQWVTFTPTYPVIDEAPLRIDDSRSPLDSNIEAAVRYARALQMSVRLEPHLDWESTLAGTYEWRRRMYVDPSNRYFDLVLEPLLQLDIQELTLGSELDASWLAFGPQWSEVRDRVQAAGIRAGHKLNHDALESGSELVKLVNTERARVHLSALQPSDYHSSRMMANAYLSRLDYVSFSFYPPVPFARAAKRMAAALRAAAGFGPELVIGEFGLGSVDVARPWHFDRSTFLNEAGEPMPDALSVRRRFYLDFLSWLRDQDLLGASPACFWTVDQYDILGILPFKDAALFRDEALREAVARYNREASSPPRKMGWTS